MAKLCKISDNRRFFFNSSINQSYYVCNAVPFWSGLEMGWGSDVLAGCQDLLTDKLFVFVITKVYFLDNTARLISAHGVSEVNNRIIADKLYRSARRG
jgi:hypothetical protein